jgi:transposase
MAHLPQQIISERIDDVVLLLEVMKKMGLPEILNQNLPRHWKQEGLDWGWVGCIWLSYIISQGDHRKVRVREWVEQRRYTIEQVCGISIRETDFTDDRLGILLKRLSKPETWEQIERFLTQNTIRAYDLAVEKVRLDATTISGHHLISEQGLFQFGHSKDDPNLPQVKLMMGMIDPLGMPLVTQVVSGEKADDGLYIPAYQQITATLNKKGLLFVGDCKMSSLSTRGNIHIQGDYYLCPLSSVGKTPELLAGWIDDAIAGKFPLIDIKRTSFHHNTETSPDKDVLETIIATGYEVCRCVEVVDEQLPLLCWQERVLIIHSPTVAKQQLQGLETRLHHAQQKLMALTPQKGRGKRQINDLQVLLQKATEILRLHRVEGLLSFNYECQETVAEIYIGRGRPTSRPKRITRKIRYQIQSVIRNETAISQAQKTFGWRAFVSNAPKSHLSLEQAVLTYRDEWIAERGFHRLKGASLSIAPMFVQRDDQIIGLINLLSLALRLLTIIEFVVRRQLITQEVNSLAGLYPEHPKKLTAQPTAERLLRAFSNITLTIIEVRSQRFGYVPPLNPLQQEIISLLGLSPDIYSNLVDNSS